MKKLILFILLISGFTAQAQTDPDIWKLDLENRGYTVEETPRESLTLIVVKLSGDTVGIIEAAGREGIYILRERLEGGKNLLPCITTTQRDTLSFKLGHQIINTTNDSTVEYWNGSVWVNNTLTTREFVFHSEEISANAATRTVLSGTSTTYLSFSGTGAVDDGGIGMIVPEDYSSGGEFYMWWTMDGTGAVSDTARIVLNLTQGNKDSTDVHSQVDETIEFKNQTYSGTAWRIIKSVSVATGLTLTAGEYIHAEIERDPSHSSDNSGDTFYIQLFVFKYISK